MVNIMTNIDDWSGFLNFYTERYAGRRTRLGVFELSGDVVNDYWLENGLPLVSIVCESHSRRRRVIITVGEMTHEVPDVVKITCQLTAGGSEDGLDILSSDHRMTILRFEK